MRSLRLSGEDFAGREPGPSAEDLRDGLAEQDTTCRFEHQVKMISFKRSFQEFLRQRLRVLGLPIRAVRPPVKTPLFRSAVELF